MKSHSVAIAAVGIGGWYPRGIARMIDAFHGVSDGFDISAWVNAYPPGAPGVVTRDGQQYGGYCAKPFALKALKDRGVEIGILLDASFWPVKHIGPLVDEICDRGYYMAADRFRIGQWASDAALVHFGVDREEALAWPGCASGCVGLDFRRSEARSLVDTWAAAWPTFSGHHSNQAAETQEFAYRNLGFVSKDPRCLGHRHDQTALGILARRVGFTDYTRPAFTAYDCEGAQPETVLVCRGM